MFYSILEKVGPQDIGKNGMNLQEDIIFDISFNR